MAPAPPPAEVTPSSVPRRGTAQTVRQRLDDGIKRAGGGDEGDSTALSLLGQNVFDDERQLAQLRLQACKVSQRSHEHPRAVRRRRADERC